MEAADEVGFMLVPEAPIWGNGMSRYTPQYTPQTYHDMGRDCRNHPCVARYSLTNEVTDWPHDWPNAIDDMREVDDIHPLVFELSWKGIGRVDGPKSGSHAYIMEHYSNISQKMGPDTGIRGQGENFWPGGGGGSGLAEFSIGARVMRLNDWCYFAPWSLQNYWPNFLQGMNHDLHAWKYNDHADRKDVVDGWGSPCIKFVQKSLSPYLLQDRGILRTNPGPPEGFEQGQAVWPYQVPGYLPGQTLIRQIEVFNGGLLGNQLALKWTAHWDSADGPEAIPGAVIGPFQVEPGFHCTQQISFAIPTSGRDERDLYVVMESIKDGKTVFKEDGLYFKVLKQLPPVQVAYLGADSATQGNWQGKYGKEGYELEVKESKLPSYADFKWTSGELFTYDAATDDIRALEYFMNPPTGKDRIAAGRYADDLTFDLDVGPSPHKLSIYNLDWDQRSRVHEIDIIQPETQQPLDTQTVDHFAKGVYTSWKIQGKVKVVIHRVAGDNASVSGIFLDPM